MTPSNLEKALTVLEGTGSRNPDLAAKYLHPVHYTEHHPHVADSVAGLRDFVGRLPPETHLKVVRAFEDGSYVFTQADGQVHGQNTFFDVFRFEDGLIVEHWAFSAPAGPPNQSGHTQTDGPTQARYLEDTEQNKEFLREYYQSFHIAGDHSSQNDRYFTTGVMARHEPGVRDGLAEFLQDVSVLMQHRTIDEIKLLLGQGDFVFIAARGTHEGEPCLYVDLYRVKDLKIVEHWGFPQKVPSQQEAKNHHGML